MIVVAILGILAALGIPVFRQFVLRSKAAEASTNLNSMFKSAASYYTQERASQGQTAGLHTGCTVSDVGPLPSNPGPQKLAFENSPEFRALGFSIADYVYFGYGIARELPGDCDGVPNNPNVYTLFANGDLDGDGTMSVFELAIATDSNNELYHSRGMYIEHELE